jgi:hypothetical protein
MIQKFSKDFVFAYNKDKNIAFHMDKSTKFKYLKQDNSDKYILEEEYGDTTTTYILNHIMNIGETPVFYIESEVEVST